MEVKGHTIAFLRSSMQIRDSSQLNLLKRSFLIKSSYVYLVWLLPCRQYPVFLVDNILLSLQTLSCSPCRHYPAFLVDNILMENKCGCFRAQYCSQQLLPQYMQVSSMWLHFLIDNRQQLGVIIYTSSFARFGHYSYCGVASLASHRTATQSA